MPSPWYYAAAAVALGATTAAFVLPREARSQAAIRTYIPLGAHGVGAGNTASQAWFIDTAERKVIVCLQPAAPTQATGAAPPSAAASMPRPSCSSAPIP